MSKVTGHQAAHGGRRHCNRGTDGDPSAYDTVLLIMGAIIDKITEFIKEMLEGWVLDNLETMFTEVNC